MFDIASSQILGKRDNQQDYFATYSFDEVELVILADGMGGHAGGEVASSLVTKEILSFLKGCEGNIDECLQKALQSSNELLKLTIGENPELEGMGTTLISAFFTDDMIIWVSVGDSLIYRIRDNEIERINADHSIGGELDEKVAQGLISLEEAKNHPQRHFLTSAVSGYEIDHIDLSSASTQANDIYVITTDGLHTLDEEEIKQICLYYKTSQEKADALTQRVEAYAKQHQDNTTLTVIQGENK